MTSNRLVYHAISQLAAQIEKLKNGATPDSQPLPTADFEEIDKQIKRLAKELYKANTLSEAQAEQTQQTLALMQRMLDEKKRESEEAARRARLDLVQALFPVLDSIEAGIKSGFAQVKMLRGTAPQAADALAAWLNGQRLLRERLLKLLEADGVTPIASKGQMFDPYRHVAVKIGQDLTQPSGIILAEQRTGYLYGDTVLRYADVVVNKHEK